MVPRSARRTSRCRRPRKLLRLTAGVNWQPHANVTIRPELRYDWYNGTAGPNGLPFHDGTSSSQLSGGVDAIFTF